MLLDKITEGLSEEQKKAVVSPARYIRITAAAGAGKTTTITSRIVYLIASGVDPALIVAFTFTEKAASEMKSRVVSKLNEVFPDLQIDIGPMFIGTIHSFCFRLLRDKFRYEDYEPLDENREAAFIFANNRRIGFDLLKDKSLKNKLHNFIASIYVVFNELIPEDVLEKEAPVFYELYKNYLSLLETHKLISFGRMIQLAVEKIEEDPSVISYIKHLIVDEYQDINRAQEKLIHLIAKSANVCIVGDPRQTIYEWRGSDDRCFVRFAQQFESENFEIRGNRRSTPEIIVAANNVALNFDEKILRNPMEPVREERGAAFWLDFEDQEDEADWIARTIQKLVGAGKCNYKDVAILLRSVKSSGPEIIKKLKQYNIPFIVGGKVGLFERDEILALAFVFTWIAEKEWPVKRYSDDTYSYVQLFRKVQERWPFQFDLKELESFKHDLLTGEFDSLIEAYQRLLTILNFRQLDPANVEHQLIMANLGRFNEVIADFEHSYRRGGRRVNWKKMIDSFYYFLRIYAYEEYDEKQLEFEDIDAVQLITVHQAKGLEWKVVFVANLVEYRFPSGMALRNLRNNKKKNNKWYVPDTLFDRERYEGSIESERKLFYVAITRAQDLLVLTSHKKDKDGKNRKNSRFIDEAGLGLSTKDEVKSYLQKMELKFNKRKEEKYNSISIEGITNYIQCPYRYFLNDVCGFVAPLNEMMGYRRAVANITRKLIHSSSDKSHPKDVVEEIFEKEFYLPYKVTDYGEGRFIKETTKEAFMREAEMNPEKYITSEEDIVRIELNFNNSVGLSDRVELLRNENGKLELRYVITSRNARSKEKAKLRLRVTALFLKKAGIEPEGAFLDLPLKNESESVSIDDESLAEVQKKIEESIEGIARKDYFKKSKESCSICDFIQICRFNNESHKYE